MKKEWKSILLLVKNRDNRRWWFRQWGIRLVSLFTAFVSAWTLLEAFGLNFTEFVERYLRGGGIIIGVCAFAICLVMSGYSSLKELKGFSHICVETERAGCSVQIRVADSYLTNAFDNYPGSAMLVGVSKAFWVQEAEPGSLLSDMWKRLAEYGVKKEEVQRKIDEALEAMCTANGKDASRKNSLLDPDRPKVYVKLNGENYGCRNCGKITGKDDEKGFACNHECLIKEQDGKKTVATICRDNYRIGTVVGVDLHCKIPEKEERRSLSELIPLALESSAQRFCYNIASFTDRILFAKLENKGPKPYGFLWYLHKNRRKVTPEHEVIRKLYLIANSEVVQGWDTSEPMKVTFDRKASVVENFPKIWEYFEEEEKKTPMPPKHILYQPLLVPLIGAGVANEGYTDMEIFSKLVDLYYEHLRASIRAGKHPAIPNLIINIRDKTAIELSGSEDATSRKIDLKTAFWYLKYRNQVNPVVNTEK